MTDEVRELLVRYAAEYETKEFLNGDPSSFMHRVSGEQNQEATAFVASMLSFGNRKAFMPKIEEMLNEAGGDMFTWIRSRRFNKYRALHGAGSFYRFFTREQMRAFLSSYAAILELNGSLKFFVYDSVRDGNAQSAARTIATYFSEEDRRRAMAHSIVPAPLCSACKRLFMFLRWMVRDNSPVDIGIWSDILDKETLIMPLDVHVMQESRRLGLLETDSATFSAARRLTATMAEVFPGDPLKGDFALFGMGVNQSADHLNPKE